MQKIVLVCVLVLYCLLYCIDGVTISMQEKCQSALLCCPLTQIAPAANDDMFKQSD